MAYTDLQQLRKELADPYKSAFDENIGDAETTIYKLSHGSVKDDSFKVYVADDLKTLTTDYTIDQEEGVITFVTAPADGASIEVTYNFSAFSDTELNNFLVSEGSVNGALLLCIDILLMDASKRFDYAIGKADLKPSQVFNNLKDLRGIIATKVSNEAAGGGVSIVNRSSRHYKDTVETETDLSRADL